MPLECNWDNLPIAFIGATHETRLFIPYALFRIPDFRLRILYALFVIPYPYALGHVP